MVVKVAGIGWIGVRTTKIAGMTKFYEEVFGLTQTYVRESS